jgi:hypothetical protein
MPIHLLQLTHALGEHHLPAGQGLIGFVQVLEKPHRRIMAKMLTHEGAMSMGKWEKLPFAHNHLELPIY